MSWVKFVNEVTVTTSGIHVQREFPGSNERHSKSCPMSHHFCVPTVRPMFTGPLYTAEVVERC